MKYFILTTILFIPSVGFSQTSDLGDVELLQWLLNENVTDWTTGILFAILGLLGSFIAVFFNIGSLIPGTAGYAEITVKKNYLNYFENKLKQAESPELITAINNVIDDYRDDLSKENWKQFKIAAVLYVLIGTLIAMIFAQDILQALVFGIGWTTIVNNILVKKDIKSIMQSKNDALENAKQLMSDQIPINEPPSDVNLGLKPPTSSGIIRPVVTATASPMMLSSISAKVSIADKIDMAKNLNI